MNEILEQIINWDKYWFLTLNNLGTKEWDPFWLFVTNKKSWILLYVLLVVLLYRKIGIKKTGIILLLAVLMIFVSDQTCNLFKHSFDRFRPCYNQELDGLMRLVKNNCGGKYGFVSAHAANHFALALFLGNIFGRKYKMVLFLVIIWATLIAYSRVYVGVHYPLDIIGGSILGSMIGYFFFRIFNKLENNKYIQS